jgi:hypothetical protein
MERQKEVNAMRQRYARLAAGLAKTGLIAQGTITERTIERPNPADPGKTKTFGPYYQWTFKEMGKTVTVNLSKAQVRPYQRAIDTHRKMEKTLNEMRELSLRILENSTQGVVKRKPRN